MAFAAYVFSRLHCWVAETKAQNLWLQAQALLTPSGYKTILKEKDLAEVAPMPYFKSPFITIAKNKSNDQFAVIIRDTGETKITPLPLKLEDIVEILKSKNYKITTSNVYFQKSKSIRSKNRKCKKRPAAAVSPRVSLYSY
ncbi:hypothetical protein E5161_06225 [Cohnella pontilimi]|uniref:Uncharacterized protein n=1 Tax=Cohnella pontilimi TaxID=2564100 RepID=A0A4U0FGF6_9BACL|nr:hypothetical protein [Cohnella pontilimi]TJY43474.1 hypothetical protein E5161_06225 [Cohnella pontilimi]